MKKNLHYASFEIAKKLKISTLFLVFFLLTPDVINAQGPAQPIKEKQEIYGLTPKLEKKKAVCQQDDYFFTTLETIAKKNNDLTSSKVLNTAVHEILSFSTSHNKYQSYLDKLLIDYTNGELDQAKDKIKVMRYVVSKNYPELQEETLFLNSFWEARNFIKLFCQVESVTCEEIKAGNLSDRYTTVGFLYELILMSISRVTTIKFFDKIKRAFHNDQLGLQHALTQQDNYGHYTPFHSAVYYDNGTVIAPLVLDLLKIAFNNNQEGLQKALTAQSDYGDTPLHKATLNVHSVIIKTLVSALKEAFTSNQQKLERALTQEDYDGWTPLHWAAKNSNAQSVRALFTEFKEVFAQNQQGLQKALIQQSNDGCAPLHMAAQNKDSDVIKTLISVLKEAFGKNKLGLRQALNHDNCHETTALLLAINEKNKEIIQTAIDQVEHEISLALKSEELLTQEKDYFLTTIEAIAQKNNNASSFRRLCNSVDEILSLSTTHENYTSYLDTFLKQYSNGDKDEATNSIKVMRYVVSKSYPELQDEPLLVNSRAEARELIKIFCGIESLTDEEIKEGSLSNGSTTLGLFYNLILESRSRITAIKFFDKIKIFYQNNPAKLQEILTQDDDNSDSTLFYRALSSDNAAAAAPLFINLLLEAFAGNPQGLQKVLVWGNSEGSTPIQKAAQNNNSEVMKGLLIALKKAFADNKQALQKILTQTDGNLLVSLTDQSIQKDSVEKQSFLRRSIDNVIHTTNWFMNKVRLIASNFMLRAKKFLDINYYYLRKIYQKPRLLTVKKFLDINYYYLRNFLVLPNRSYTPQKKESKTGFFPLHDAVINYNPHVMNLFIVALNDAFSDNKEGLKQALTQQNPTGFTPLHCIVWNAHPQATGLFFAVLKKAFAGDSKGLQDALTQKNKTGKTPLDFATMKNNWTIANIIHAELNKIKSPN